MIEADDMFRSRIPRRETILVVFVYTLLDGAFAGVPPSQAFVPPTSPVPYTSAIFTCGDQIFPATPLPVLFPPSEITVRLIDNITAAVEVNRASLKAFCSKIQEYSACLQAVLTTPMSPLDTVLAQLLDPVHIPEIFIQFCMDTDLITSEFECTYHKVIKMMEHPCNGGIFELFDHVAGNNLADTVKLCKHMNSAQQCRIKSQLRPCSQELASKMEAFYRGMRSRNCSLGDIGGTSQGQFMECAAPYLKKMGEIGNEAETSRNLSEAVTASLNYVCGKRDEWMSCIRHVQKTSTHPIDKLVFKFMIPDNLEKIFNFTCEEIKLSARHASCVQNAMGMITLTNTSCLNVIGDTLAANVTQLFKVAQTSPAMVDQMVPAICKNFDPVPGCLAPVFEECDDELASKFRQMSTWFLDACGSDSSVTWKQGGDDMSHGNRNLATVSMVVLTLLASVNFWM